MKTPHRLIIFTLIAAFLLIGCGVKEAPAIAVPAVAQAGDLTGLKECEFQVSDSDPKYAAECGTLTVPENRDKTDSRLIVLPAPSGGGASKAPPAKGGTNQSVQREALTL